MRDELRIHTISLLVLSVTIMLFGINLIYTGLAPKGVWAALLGVVWFVVGLCFALVTYCNYRVTKKGNTEEHLKQQSKLPNK